MSQLLRDKLTYALELVDGSKDNPERNSQMLWNDQHSYLRFLLVDCIRLVDLKQDIRDMANERTCQNCLNAHKPEWCGYGADTCGNFELDEWISVKDQFPPLGKVIRLKFCDSGKIHRIGLSTKLHLEHFCDNISVEVFLDNQGWVSDVTHWKLINGRQRKIDLTEWVSVQDKLPAIGDRVEMLIHSGDYVKTKISSITIFDDGVCFADISGCAFRVLSWRLLPKDKFKVDMRSYPLTLLYDDVEIELHGLCVDYAVQLANKLNELWMSAADKS